MPFVMSQPSASKSKTDIKRETGTRRPFHRVASPSTREQSTGAAITVGAANDVHERQADAVADAVMSGALLRQSLDSSEGQVQRKCAGCEEEEAVQRKAAPHGSMGGGQITGLTASKINQVRQAGGQKLPAATSEFMQERFNRDFNDVRVHTNSAANQLSQSLNAKAFTIGNDVFFGANQFRPEHRSGQHLIAHELTHTLQQSGSSVADIQRATSSSEGGAVEAPVPAKNLMPAPFLDRFKAVTGRSAANMPVHNGAAGDRLAREYDADGVAIRGETFVRSSVDPSKDQWLMAHEFAHALNPNDNVVRRGKCPARQQGETEGWASQPFFMMSLGKNEYYSKHVDLNVKNKTVLANEQTYESNKPRTWVLWNFEVKSADLDPARLGWVKKDIKAIRERASVLWNAWPGKRCYARDLAIRGNSDCHGSQELNLGLNAGRRNRVISEFFGGVAVADTSKIKNFSRVENLYGRNPTNNASAMDRAKNRSVWIHEVLRPVDTIECANQVTRSVREKNRQQEENQKYMAESRVGEWHKEIAKADFGDVGNCMRDMLQPAAEALFASGANYNSTVYKNKYMFMKKTTIDKVGTGEKSVYDPNMGIQQYFKLSTSALDKYIEALAESATFAEFEKNFWGLIWTVSNSVAAFNKHREAEYVFCEGSKGGSDSKNPFAKNTSNFARWACAMMQDKRTVWHCANKNARDD